jgi:hypothetical protein
LLSKLQIKTAYRSDECDLINEFYIPCLAESKLYKRAVGFFSSTGLSIAAKGLHAFLKGGGTMQLVASPHLSSEDINAISKGYLNREEAEQKALLMALDGEFENLVQQRLSFLAWLIEYNRLDIKIASVYREGVYGIYHEKLGIFYDGENFIAFTGSPNESASGLVSNFECIDVFCSWKPEDKARAMDKWRNFDKLWENETNNLNIYTFPEAAKKSLLRFRPGTPPENDPEVGEIIIERDLGNHKIPKSIKLRGYQEEAIENWFKADGRGTLKMATGSGKTITSLALAAKLYEKIGLKALIIICPYRHLVSQWSKECERFGLQPIKCFESRYQWLDFLKTKLYNLENSDQTLCAITTNATFAMNPFQECLPFFPPKTLLIADEVHNLGATNLLNALPKKIGLRLGLSATPERWFDDKGTQGLYNYFGTVLKPEFTLKDAMDNKALVPYTYHPIFVENR